MPDVGSQDNMNRKCGHPLVLYRRCVFIAIYTSSYLCCDQWCKRNMPDAGSQDNINRKCWHPFVIYRHRYIFINSVK